jgi:predicted unusual protein kinase regulating ubiquinone biosynthesis (AarF/ABC1/UbiB family)
LCRWREHVFLQQDAPTDDVQPFGEACTNDGIWEANYEISARFLYLSVKRLRGLWTKSAQYLSSRADFMPLGYIRELSKLQDQAPETPWQDIQHLLPVKLKRDLLKIDTKPIASASIGQVHLAQMMVNGQERKVVIKVQHPHARTLMLDDFWSLLVICRIVGWLEPDYAFMEILMREWAFEARKELDFTNELEHLQQAQDALVAMFPAKESVVYTNTEHRTPFRAEVPKPIAQYSSPNVLVMDYCEGCRVDNFSQLEKWSLNRVDVMDGLSQTFAHFMYCSEIFNGDPHPGNFLIRQGANSKLEEEGFTLVLLDWGLAKKLPVKKRTAFCQMVYAAATLDYGLLLDSYKTMGLKMKREDAGQSMEDMRFFLRDMAPRTQARRAIKSKIKQGQALATRNKEKVPMESKAYPGELFFFIRVTELLHGLGSKMDADLRYLETIRPYAEKGLRHLLCPETEDAKFEKTVTSSPVLPNAPDLQKNLTAVLEDFENEGQFIGGQICVLDKNGKVEVDVFAGTLGGLKDHIDMKRDSLILGYSCTKAITATLAHRMVEEGYLSLDEPISKRVWKNFCPTQVVPSGLARSMELSAAEAELRWKWKRQITLRHILNHTAGLWAAFPPNLTIKSMASCETCFPAFEYNPSAPEKTILPSRMPGEKSEYHFMSFGWLVAGTVCGAYALKHKKHNATYEEVYNAILFPKLSQSIKDLGFCPLGAHRDQNSDMLANTVTSDVRASEMMQKQRERSLMGDEENAMDSTMREMMKTFHGVEFLLDPRIWNSRDALSANVPAAGGRFSAAALAQFYHELGNVQSLLSASTLKDLVQSLPPETSTSAMQGVTRIANDTSNQRTRLSLGFQLIQTERDKENVYSGLGHAGVGGSIGFWHRPSGLSISLMLNKADGEVEATTMKILRTIGEYYNI